MAIQYSGNAQTSTFTPTTKQDIINSVGAALLAAGWTTVSGGSGTTAWKLQSATTPQGFAIRVLMKDNGGTCVTFSLESSDGAVVGPNSTTVGGGFLNPITDAVYTMVCCKYQAFIYMTPHQSIANTFIAFGVPYVPAWVAGITTNVGWMHGNGVVDTSTDDTTSFRTLLNTFTTAFNSQTPCAQQALYNGFVWSVNAVNSPGSTIGTIGLASYVAPPAGARAGYRWGNDTALLIDALIAWGDMSRFAEAKFRGQLWDSVISTDTYSGDDTANFDGHDWTCVTTNNGNGVYAGTLLTATS